MVLKMEPRDHGAGKVQAVDPAELLDAQRLVKPQVASAHGIASENLLSVAWHRAPIQLSFAPPVVDARKDVELAILALTDPGSESAIP